MGKILVIFVALTAAKPALAQTESANFGSETFRPSPHADSFFSVESGAIAPSLDVRASLFLNYAYRPLVLYQANGLRLSSPLEHRLDAQITGAITLFDRLSIGLLVPVGLYQTDDPARAQVGIKPPDHTVFGDFRLEPKIGILNQAHHFIDLALLLDVTFPSSSRHSFAGDSSVSFGGELDVSHRFGPFRLAANFGYQWRNQQQYFDLTIGQELYYRFGAGFDLARLANKVAPIEFIGEIFGQTYAPKAFSGVAENPIEWLLGLRYSPLPWFALQAGAGRAILSGYGAPDFRAFFGATFVPLSKKETLETPPPALPPTPPPPPASQPVTPPPPPAIVDSDGDGVPDDIDKCPNKPGPAASNGCPQDLDSDGDGIPDSIDKCPNEPETINGFEDFDGCPDQGPSLIVITKTQIEIKEQVFFETGSEKIKKQSYNLLNQVAAAIINHVGLGKVRIEGHTDDVGNDAANMKLSQRRADAVRRYLIAEGVPQTRIEAIGYGETKPIASNQTTKGRELNRRVMFTILDGAQPPAKVEPKKPETKVELKKPEPNKNVQ